MSVEVFRTVDEIREMLARVRRMGATVGLVPTMGALHEGHGQLIDAARQETDCVVVSIFVNPLQFDRPEDLERYPRNLDVDKKFCDDRGADLIFAPAPAAMYAPTHRSHVEVAGVSEGLCGQSRPGHFRGVATVVLKLFNITQPDRAYFGEKDAQQLAVVRRMVRDLNLTVEIVSVRTVRESDGLALSSRNRHLTTAERKVAPILFQALVVAQKLIAAGATDPAEVKSVASAILAQQPSVRVEYLEVVDPDEMRAITRIRGPVRVAAALWLGSTRLIDNVLCEPGKAEGSGLIQ